MDKKLNWRKARKRSLRLRREGEEGERGKEMGYREEGRE